MASITIQNAPSIDDMTMQRFRSESEKMGGLARSCRFLVRINPVGELLRLLDTEGMSRDLMYLTEMAEIPGRGFMNVDLRYYGPSFKLPFQTTYEDINLGFICRARGLEREFFDNWMTVINPVNTFDFNYRDDYRSTIEIFHFTDTPTIDRDPGGSSGKSGGTSISSGKNEAPNNAIYKATIHNAYPILVNQQPLLWTDDQFMKLIVSFTYTHWTREGIDPERSALQGNDLVRGIASENEFLRR